MPENFCDGSYGISAVGLAIPKLALKLEELAALRGVEARKMTTGLGCCAMSLCDHDENDDNVVNLAIRSAKRAVNHWITNNNGDISKIGLVVVATESAFDLSRPLSAWVLQALNLHGAIRSYELKHACYGGAAALLQSIEWLKSRPRHDADQVALVVSSDVALYDQLHPGEPTQGAGAVAFITSRSPTIAEIDNNTYAWSKPSYDFYRPSNQEYPQVNGHLSISCYREALIQCFSGLLPNDNIENLAEYTALTFHTPFYKMVVNAVKALGNHYKWSPEKVRVLVNQQIAPYLDWNQQIGNAYTASLGFAMARALSLVKDHSSICAFSFGSGCGAELFLLRCINNQQHAAWVTEFMSDLSSRRYITRQEYATWRANWQQQHKGHLINRQYEV